MRIDILTLFPEIALAPLSESILQRARAGGRECRPFRRPAACLFLAKALSLRSITFSNLSHRVFQLRYK